MKYVKIRDLAVIQVRLSRRKDETAPNLRLPERIRQLLIALTKVLSLILKMETVSSKTWKDATRSYRDTGDQFSLKTRDDWRGNL